MHQELTYHPVGDSTKYNDGYSPLWYNIKEQFGQKIYWHPVETTHIFMTEK